MELLENKRCTCISIAVFDINTNCVLNTPYYAHVETGQAPEQRVAVVQTTTHQGICLQDSSLTRQILSGLNEITNLNEASLTNTADMISNGKIASNQTPSFFTSTDDCSSLPNILTGR